MNTITKIKTIFWHPNDVLNLIYVRFVSKRYPKLYSSYLFKKELGRSMNWKNPKDLDQKITWMSFNTDTSLWSRLADKYLVREFVKEMGCEEIIIPLLGRWKSVDEIDFSSLPDKFVIKTNCSCGDSTIVKNKSRMDVKYVKKRLQNALDDPMGYETAELHYLKIDPCIIAEQLLEPRNGIITDYKVYCFHSKPYCIFTGSNRDVVNHTVDFNVFSTKWERWNHCMSPAYRNDIQVPKPDSLNEMLRYAEILSKPFPFVRVDFYDIDGKVYLGEMTFTPKKGRQLFFTKEFSEELGALLHIENIK